MPTLSKLVAAIVFGALAYVASGMVIGALPDTVRQPVWFVPINTVLGIVLGWRFCGAKSGAGYLTAMAVGLTTAVAFTFVALFVWSFMQMMQRSMRLAYDNASQAIMGGIASGVEFGAILATQPVVLVLLAAGGVVGGLAAEPFAERRPG